MCVCLCVCVCVLSRFSNCPTLWNLMDYSLPGCPVHGDSPGKNTGVSCLALFQGIFSVQGLNWHLMSPALAGGFFTTSTTWEVDHFTWEEECSTLNQIILLSKCTEYEQLTHRFSSVTQSCLTLCDPMYHSMPGLLVHDQL